MRIRLSRDLVAGAFFSTAAVIGLLLSSRLPFGSPQRMGPGFFPTGLSAILLIFGAIILVRALLRQSEEIGTINLRPLLVVLTGVVVFSSVVERWGFAIAAALLIGIARLARPDFRPWEVACVAICLIALSASVFLFALKLPLRLLPV